METASTPSLLGPVTRQSVARLCRLLYERRLVIGAGGNVCARFEDGFLATPSGYSLRDIEPEHLIFIDAAGTPREASDRRPSKELQMHLGIFAARSDVQVVSHVHGAFLTAVTTSMPAGPDTLPPICPGHVYYARPLPMIPFFIPGTGALADAVRAAFENPELLALLLKNHGLITVGKTLAEAINTAEEVDEAAMIYMHTHGKAEPLSDGDVATLMAERRAAYAKGHGGSA